MRSSLWVKRGRPVHVEGAMQPGEVFAASGQTARAGHLFCLPSALLRSHASFQHPRALQPHRTAGSLDVILRSLEGVLGSQA